MSEKICGHVFRRPGKGWVCGRAEGHVGAHLKEGPWYEYDPPRLDSLDGAPENYAVVDWTSPPDQWGWPYGDWRLYVPAPVQQRWNEFSDDAKRAIALTAQAAVDAVSSAFEGSGNYGYW